MAINIGSNFVVPLIQYAQLKVMFGDFQTAMDLANRAIPLTGSRDEVRLPSFNRIDDTSPSPGLRGSQS
jgi:hypothetical protein